MNKCIFIGRLCADPTIRQTQNGKRVANYRIAVDRPKSKGETDFFTVVAFGNSAEFVEKYLKKGMRIVIEGHMQPRSFEDKEGRKVTVTELIAERHEFCESRQSGNAEPTIAKERPAPASDAFVEIDDLEDIPF